MGSNIQAGQDLVATTAAGGLNQYYGLADTAQTTVTGGLSALSTQYTIPAGEAYAGAAYELRCGGTAVWGAEHLQLAGYLDGVTIHASPAVLIDLSVFDSAADLCWTAAFDLVCADGVSEWLASWSFVINQIANNVIPGTAADNTCSVCDSATSARTAAVSSPVTVQFWGGWTGASGSPVIYNDWTIFRKIS